MGQPAEELFDRTAEAVPGDRRRWQAIQDGMSSLPEDSLRSLLTDMFELMVDLHHGREPKVGLEDTIQTWYQRVLFVQAQEKRPVDPGIDPAEWPERWFG